MQKKPAVAAENFLFKKTDFLPTSSQSFPTPSQSLLTSSQFLPTSSQSLPISSQSPGVSSIFRTREDLPTSTQSEKEDNKDLINAEKSVIATTISIISPKETHLEGGKTLTKEDKSVLLTEDKEKVRIYHLLLPLFMLLVAFMCLLCILTVLVC